jgi:hypothetical protein
MHYILCSVSCVLINDFSLGDLGFLLLLFIDGRYYSFNRVNLSVVLLLMANLVALNLKEFKL